VTGSFVVNIPAAAPRRAAISDYTRSSYSVYHVRIRAHYYTLHGLMSPVNQSFSKVLTICHTPHADAGKGAEATDHVHPGTTTGGSKPKPPCMHHSRRSDAVNQSINQKSTQSHTRGKEKPHPSTTTRGANPSSRSDVRHNRCVLCDG